MKKINELAAGLFLVIVIAYVSKGIEGVLAPYIRIEALTIGILMGMAYRLAFGLGETFVGGVSFSLKKLLKAGIVLLGFKLSFGSIIELGPRLLLTVIIFVALVMALSVMIGKALGADSRLSALVGVGSCICGASAVVAMGPCIDAKEDDCILAVSVVSFWGAVGVIVYSAVAAVSGITDVQYGIWSGLSLHGVAHAIAAAFARGDDAGNIGTVVKMARVLMLVPLSIILSAVFAGKEEGNRAKFPMYVGYFIIAGVLSSLGIMPEVAVGFLSSVSSWFIMMAMISMGIMVDFKQIKSRGMKSIAIGTVLFVITGPLSYALVLKMF
ncbi:conserved hypothetical integral membrane protein [Peptoclostridium litorale DSM 5388]|uniref:Uncharacterized protein n=1 Tax=Peptoclostridium litorale DSM 5388 TaxID=1121324 RepID=A0A069RGV9_PEPLI|nr:putative sulfate exporter family transporter [Peptoclostridium litorale]KDR96269.1 hypothetical protein UPF0324 [Peptoclostridium litorale DSM 5388]SIO14859.1 conserved hypothetical integral membrane protein [Peptoclostridium litorale DSM 5388]